MNLTNRSLKRIVFGGVERTKVQFTDVLLADIFTSYARVFGDLWTVISVASFHPQTLRSWNSGKSIAQRQRYAQSWLVSLLISLPYLWRFRQCIAEYRYSPAINHLQLFNALKYASIFPAILVNYLSINWDSDMIFYAGCV
jgi:hypothetical protein